MTEFELIRLLLPKLPTGPQMLLGAGDDCAILKPCDPDQELLFKTDSVVENVHFTADTPPEKVGRKALARCLSDMAAMAGQPTVALVTLGLPTGFDPAWVERCYDGLTMLARQYGVAIAGGETTRSLGAAFLSISLLGVIPKGRRVLRSHAVEGDGVFVTGELGGSIGGRHLDFEPRLAEASWLAAHFTLHALIDISDGLAGDLGHILIASNVGAELFAPAIPIARVAKLRAREVVDAKPALLAALTDGEDFELLFTLPSSQAVTLADAWKKQFPLLKLSCIGRITAKSGLRLRDANGIRTLPTHGFTHFT